jgi:hypothetical protein
VLASVRVANYFFASFAQGCSIVHEFQLFNPESQHEIVVSP